MTNSNTSVQNSLAEMFGLEGKVAVVTGGTGVLGGAMSRGLAKAGAKVGVLGRRGHLAQQVVSDIESTGGEGLALSADVLVREQLEAARDTVLDKWGKIDILVNAAGGNMPAANVGPDNPVFELPTEALRQVFDLNLLGTVLPTQVFGKTMADRTANDAQEGGCIVNISSMAAQRPLTKVIGYAAAKAAVDNFTKWMAEELSRNYGSGLRVNAMAPGFFVGEQNRRMLLNEDGSLTARGSTIIQHTPAGRFGEPEELVGTLVWLCSPAASFINGIVVPVDGGFSAFGGV